MSESKPSAAQCPVSPADLRQQVHEEVDRIADFCESCELRFLGFEKSLKDRLWGLARLLVALFLLTRHRRLQASPHEHPG